MKNFKTLTKENLMKTNGGGYNVTGIKNYKNRAKNASYNKSPYERGKIIGTLFGIVNDIYGRLR